MAKTKSQTARKTAAKPSPDIRVINVRSEPESMAPHMNVDRVMAAIRSAETGYMRDLFVLYRDMLGDGPVQTEISKRKLAVMGDKLTILARDEKNPSDTAAADAIRAMVDGCRTWTTGCVHLMDGALWPVSIVEKVFTAAGGRYELTDLAPVPHYLIDYTTGFMRIHDVDPASGTILTTTHAPDPARYIIHRGHLLSTPDTWGGPLRAILFWWLLSTMNREWWARFLDRYGSPFLVGKYRKGDDASKAVLRSAFALAVKLGGLVVNEDTSVEIQQAASAQSGDAYEKFLTLCQREKSKLILGQTLSSEAQSTGMNSGVATMQEGVRQDIREWDAHTLGETLRLQLFTQFLQINRISAGTPSAIWGSESPASLKSTGELLTAFYNAGLQVTDEGIAALSRRAGLPLERRQISPGLTQAAFSAALRPLR